MTAVDVGAAAEHLRSRIDPLPRILIVLGSGLGLLEDALEDRVAVPFADVPGFPRVTVQGHAGRYAAGRLAGVDVLLQCGRFHLYEGGGHEAVAAPVRVAVELGVRILVLTNAAGGVRRTLEPGDVVLLGDHLNWTFTSPLRGPVRPGETRFPDMSEPYDARLRTMARNAARTAGERLEEGTYAGMLGPQYETAAEVRMLERVGADVVGMSTVPEVLVARAAGMRCMGFSVVANKAVGLFAGTLSHEEVIAQVQVGGARLARILRALLPRVAEELYSEATK